MNFFKKYKVMIGSFILLVVTCFFSVFIGAVYGSERYKKFIDLSTWNQDDLPPLLQDLPSGITASVVPNSDNNTWFKISHSGENTVSIPIFEVPIQEINDCRLQYYAWVKTEDVKEKVYLEMLCFINDTPYFSRGILQYLSGTLQDTQLHTLFNLTNEDSLEKLQLGIRMEGSGTVWVRGISVWKSVPSIFDSISFIQFGWLGAFLGIMGGLYGTVAGLCVPKGKGKKVIKGLGYFVFIFCSISLILGLYALSSGHIYGIWYPLIHTGLLGLVIFIPIHIMTLRNYQKNELQRMKAMDSMDSLS